MNWLLGKDIKQELNTEYICRGMFSTEVHDIIKEQLTFPLSLLDTYVLEIRQHIVFSFVETYELLHRTSYIVPIRLSGVM